MKVNRFYRDQYFDGFMDYLRERTDKEQAILGRKPFSDSTLRMYATDTFYLEKREERPFIEWLKDDDTLNEAYKCLCYHLRSRKKPESDALYYQNRMVILRDYLESMK